MSIRLAPAALPLLLITAACATAGESPAVQREAAGTTNGWDTRAELPEQRTEVSVTTDGQRIWLAGGFARAADQRASAPRTMYVYDPATNEWSTAGQIPEGVNHAGFAHHDGRLYIVGGFRENTFTPIGNVRIYDIATGQWTEGAPMPTPRGALAVVVLNGRIHAIGGNAAQAATLDHAEHGVGDDESSVGTHEVYDIATNSWQRRAAMPTPRNHLGAAVVNGRIHVVAGRVGRNFEMTAHEVYDPTTDAWSAAAPLPTGRSGVAVVERGGRVYVFGGETFTAPERTFGDAERYDPRTAAWEALSPMPTPRHGLGAAVVGGSIHVLSGGPSPGFAFSGSHEVLTAAP